MPKIGDMCTAKDLGRRYTDKRNQAHRYIWSACLDCGKERWVNYRKGKPENARCSPCATEKYLRSAQAIARLQQRGPKSPRWTGGRHKQPDGYIMITLQPENAYYGMANKGGQCREHRLIIAQFLGRCLEQWEVVHHKNGIRDDNRIENLEIMSRVLHHGIDTTIKARIGSLESQVARLEKRILLLEAENILLRANVNAKC